MSIGHGLGKGLAGDVIVAVSPTGRGWPVSGTKLRILVADDHPLIASGIREALDRNDDMEVVGEAHSGAEALALVARTNPHLALIDIRMPGMDGLACLERVRSKYPKVRVIMLSACCEQAQIEAAFARGATAYIVKSVNPVDLASAIRQAFDQNVFHAVGARNEPVEHAAAATAEPTDLTKRELAILRAVARGLSNQAISQDLWVTEQTVKFHLTNVYRKLGVSNRTAAARYAHQHGLVESYV